MMSVFPPAALFQEQDLRDHDANQLRFAKRYEKHLNDNLANYGDPIAHDGVPGKLNERTNITKRGRKCCFCVTVWIVLLLVVITVGGVLLSLGVRKQSLASSDSIASGSAIAQITTTSVGSYVASTIVSSASSSVSIDLTSEVAESSTTTTLTTVSQVSQSSLAPNQGPFVTSTANRPTAKQVGAQNTFTATRSNNRASSISSTKTNVNSTSSLSTPVHTTIVPSSMETTSSKAIASIFHSISKGTETLATPASVSIPSTASAKDPSSSTDKGIANPSQTDAGGLIGFCGTRGMACSGKTKRDPGAAPDEPAALLILEAALATFASTPTTFVTMTSTKPIAAKPSSSTSDSDATPTTLILSPASGSYTVHPIVGLCGNGGMACMERRKSRIARVN